MNSPPKIAHASCPQCCAKLAERRVYSQHTFGDWNEMVSFECGLRLHYSPNFQRVEEEAPCRNSAAYKEQAHKEMLAMQRLRKFLLKMPHPDGAVSYYLRTFSMDGLSAEEIEERKKARGEESN